LNTTDRGLLAWPRKSGVLAVNRTKETDKSIGKTFFEATSVAAPSFIAVILIGKHLPGHAGVVDGHVLDILV
jgi:hypothetical protein